MGYLYLSIALVLNAIANILMKIGASHLNSFKGYGFMEGLFKNYLLVIGCILFALNVIFYVLALSKINLSVGYPIMLAGGLVIITIVSYFFLKESITVLQLAGIFFLLVGIVLIAVQYRS